MLMPIGTNKTPRIRAPQSSTPPIRSAVVPKSDELSDTLEAAALDLAQLSSMNSRFHTGVSSGYGDEQKDQVPEPKERSGLVLLYAPNFEQLSPAYVFAGPELTIGR